MSPVSEAKKRANAKYTKANYDEIKVRVPKGKKEIIQQHAANMNESTTAFINRAIDETMERDNAPSGTMDVTPACPPEPPEKPEKHYKPFTESDASRIDLKELLTNIRYQLDIGMTFGDDVLISLMEKARQQEKEKSPE